MKKKVGIFLVLGLIIFVILSAYLVSALSSYDLSNAASKAIDWLKAIFVPFFAAILGTSKDTPHFFAKILLVFLLYFFVLLALKKIKLFKDYSFAAVLVSAIVSILAVRYMSELDFIEGVLVPYGTLGVALSVFLPVFVFFLVIHYSEIGSGGRKLALILFVLVFVALWWSRAAAGKVSETINWIYGLGLVFVGLAILFDSQIKKYFNLSRNRKYNENTIDEAIAVNQKKTRDFEGVDSDEARDLVRRARERIRDLERERAKLF